MKMNRILNILIPILIVMLVFVAVWEGYNKASNEKTAREAEAELSKLRIPSDENAINFVPATENTVIDDGSAVMLSYEDFLRNAKRTSYHVGETNVTYRFARTLVSGGNDMYMLHFKMRAESEAAKVKVSFGIEHTYYATTEWRDYYVPCIKGKIDMVKIMLLTDFQKLYLSDVQILQYDSLNVKPAKLKNGSYNTQGWEGYYPNEADGLGIGRTMDITGDGEYIYSAGDNVLTIAKINPDGTEIVSTLTGIGNARHIELRDNKTLGVASRENGVYLVNIEDKTKPYIESYYNALEIANDVCFSGDYMFVASRYFGVEIVNISDIKNPSYVSRIVNSKECFRCTVDGNYLFVSCWATSEVEVYDISVLNEPEMVTSISVDGRCGEAFVEDNLIYIISGYWGKENADDVGDVGYATGNGMVIYDISDIKNPKWLSTAKTDGGIVGVGYDDWSVSINNGYAYFTNSFGGLYVYDVSDPKKPTAVAHAGTPVYNQSDNYIDFSKNPRTVFPYDISEFVYSPVMGIYVDRGAIYYSGYYNDVYRVDFDRAEADIKNINEFEFSIADDDKKSYDYELYLSDYDINALVAYDKWYIAGARSGLILLDESFNIIAEILTVNPVKDVKVTADGYIITAETTGVGVYLADGNGLYPVSFIESEASLRNVSSVGVTGDGNYAVVQASWTKTEIVDLRNKNMPVFVTEIIGTNGKTVGISAMPRAGNMYYRNIVNGTVDGAVGIGGTGNMVWLGSKDGKLQVMNYYPNSYGTETDGTAVTKAGDKVITVYANGIYIYEPLTATESSNMKLERYYIPNVRVKGKISIGGDIMVSSNHTTGLVQIMNISDVQYPYLIASVSAPRSTGVALIEEKRVVVPLRHGGIMTIDLD